MILLVEGGVKLLFFWLFDRHAKFHNPSTTPSWRKNTLLIETTKSACNPKRAALLPDQKLTR
jgi:hypothetical protein